MEAALRLCGADRFSGDPRETSSKGNGRDRVPASLPGELVMCDYGHETYLYHGGRSPVTLGRTKARKIASYVGAAEAVLHRENSFSVEAQIPHLIDRFDSVRLN